MSTSKNISALTSMHRSEIRQRNERLSLGNMGYLFTLLLFAVLAASMLLAIVAGTTAYSGLHDLRQNADTIRSSQNLIVNSIRANDVTDCAAIGQGPEGKMLLLTESDNGTSYETRIYLHQGHVVQEYALASSPFTPEKATVLATSSTFDLKYSKGLLTVITDQGEAYVALRSVKGGA